ncbi:MAG: hypothetical protein FIA99_00255 [Ruminiclostridium sp.]|nr:hypothetical protein [Ruminiclostridium sp.]
MVVIYPQSLISHLGSQPVRTYIRAALEYLDLQYLYNQKQIPGTVELGELTFNESYEENNAENNGGCNVKRFKYSNPFSCMTQR